MEIVKKDESPKFDGVEIDLRGRTYVLCDVGMEFFRHHKDYWDTLQKQCRDAQEHYKATGQFPELSLVEALDRWVPLLLASFHVNYPEMDAATLDRILTPKNMNAAINGALRANGFEPKAEASEGEAKPVVQ